MNPTEERNPKPGEWKELPHRETIAGLLESFLCDMRRGAPAEAISFFEDLVRCLCAYIDRTGPGNLCASDRRLMETLSKRRGKSETRFSEQFGADELAWYLPFYLEDSFETAEMDPAEERQRILLVTCALLLLCHWLEHQGFLSTGDAWMAGFAVDGTGMQLLGRLGDQS